MMNYKLGADPEMFMADRMGQLKAACGRIGGTKQHPMPMGIGDGFFVQEDNVAIEFNIPPSDTKEAFSTNLSRAVHELSNGVDQMYQFQIINLSAASFPAEELTSPAAQEFGCDPDYNAWTGRKNPRPKATDANLRSCGGHVHIGLEYPMRHSPTRIIKAMDLFLGVPSVLMDKGELRKELYGKAGAFRAKIYGVEYRTLSNFWVFNAPLHDWVWDNVGRALDAVESQLVDFDHEQESILDAIDNNNKERANELVNKYGLEVVYV